MNVGYARPEVTNLTVQLVGWTVHPDLFPVYLRKSLAHGNYQVELAIGEAGHSISISGQGRSVTELVCAVDQPVPKRRVLWKNRIRGNRTETVRISGGMCYHLSQQIDRVDPDVFANLHEELTGDRRRADLSYGFPSTSRFQPEAISLMRAETYDDSVVVHAFHTFPENHAVLRTQSLMEFSAE